MTTKELIKEYNDEKYNGMGSKITDDFHTMSELYYHRMFLFSILVSLAQEKGFTAWKSKLHADGTMFDGFFIVGITTLLGNYSYHYPVKFWEHFDCPEYKTAPAWKGQQACDLFMLITLITDFKDKFEDYKDYE